MNAHKRLVKCYRVGTTNQIFADRFDFRQRSHCQIRFTVFCWKIFARKQTRWGRSEKTDRIDPKCNRMSLFQEYLTSPSVSLFCQEWILRIFLGKNIFYLPITPMRSGYYCNWHTSDAYVCDWFCLVFFQNRSSQSKPCTRVTYWELADLYFYAFSCCLGVLKKKL